MGWGFWWGCCTGSGWLINWMWAAGQAGFLFAPSSFAGLKDSFKMRFPSNSIPPSPQNISGFFPKFFFPSGQKVDHWRFFYGFLKGFQFAFVVLVALLKTSAPWSPSKAGTWRGYHVTPCLVGCDSQQCVARGLPSLFSVLSSMQWTSG